MKDHISSTQSHGMKVYGVSQGIGCVQVQAEQDSKACSTTTMEMAAWQSILWHCVTMFPLLLRNLSLTSHASSEHTSLVNGSCFTLYWRVIFLHNCGYKTAL